LGSGRPLFWPQKNNEDLLSPFEYQGWFNLKGYTKGYFLNYLKIKGLFPAIAQQARLFQQKVNGELLFDMICSVLSKLPADLVDNKTRIELANYLCMESFNNISFGEGGNYQQFARDLTDIFQERLKKITVMQDSSAATAQSDLSQIAYVESLPTAITLPVNMVTPFAEQMNVWLHMFFSSDEKSVFDFNGIDRSQLAHQFKYFMDGLLRQTERLKQGVVGCFTEPDGSITLPYSESNFLRCLFTLTTDLTPNLPSYKEERMPYKEAYWLCAEKVLESGFQVMVTIRVLQNTQNSTEVAKASAIHFLFDALKEYLKVFSDVYQVFLQELEKKLSSMSGVQLARICFSEMEFMNSSSLIGIVLKNPTLWSLMNKAFEEEDKMLYSENAPAIIKLRQFHEDFNLFLILARELELISQVESKGVLIKEISRIFANLPQFLQTELATTLNKVQGEFRELHRRHSLELEERKQGKEEFHISAEKSSPVTNHGDNLESAQLPTQKSSSEIETVDVQRHASNLFFFSLPDISKFLSSSNKFPAQKEELPSVIETKF
jgi:effector protein B